MRGFFAPLRMTGMILLSIVASVVSALAQDRILTKAVEVRSLTPAEAEQGVPAKLRGVVVFIESTSAMFLQDDTSTTFFRVRTRPLPAIGDEIEVTGKTRMGLYLPGLDFSTYVVLGQRALPPGIPATYDDLHFGRYHYRRVTVEGVVRSIAPFETEKSLMRLALGSRVIDVRVEALPLGRSFVDSRVRVTGLAAGMINTPRRQLVQPSMRVVDWTEVEVLAPAPPATAAPAVSAEELLAFNVSGLGQQRVRISGTVLATLDGDQTFLQDGTRSFAVRFGQLTPLNPGDRVTVVGFPSMEQFSASVVDAELIERQPGTAPPPIDITSLDELYEGPSGLHGRFDGSLVRVEVALRDAFKNEGGSTLLVQSRKRTLQARVPDSVELPAVGSVIRLTGICMVETAVTGSGFASRPGVVSLRATSPAHLEVVRRAGWWTPRRLATLLAILLGVTLLASLWIAALRRQVGRQTTALRRRIESEAALEERQRIAREFHDTLEQELAGVTLRLDALATREIDDKGRQLVTASRNLVTRIQTETRDLIGDLRDPTETAGDLAAALSVVAARQAADSGANIRVKPTSDIPALAPAIVHDLRMIARESVTNALKHGRATDVAIGLAHRDSHLVLTIVDNGSGFDAAAATQSKRGHFGCAGIRERCRKIGAEVTWRSALQKGTTVEVTMPLAQTATLSAGNISSVILHEAKSPAGHAQPERASTPQVDSSLRSE